MPLKQVKSKIKSVDKIHKVTKAMEAVSAVKMRQSQERALIGRPYAHAALSILKNLTSSIEGVDSPLAEVRDEVHVCLVVITSDKGLAGSLNSGVLKEAQKKADFFDRKNVEIIAVGKKANDYFTTREYHISDRYDNSAEMIDVQESKAITERLTKSFLEKAFDSCYVVYPNFISTFEQAPVIRQILPISLESITEVVRGITPEAGKYSQPKEEEKDEALGKTRSHSYEIEPSGEEVLIGLFPHLLSVLIYHGLLESRASEHSARMVAMKNASDKADEFSGELQLQYNNERQAQITAEVSEIVSGIETT